MWKICCHCGIHRCTCCHCVNMLPLWNTDVYMLPLWNTHVYILPLWNTHVYILPLWSTDVYMLPLWNTDVFMFIYIYLRRSEMTMDGWHILIYFCFVLKFINFWLGCSSVAYGWKDQCGNGSLYCRHHVYVWFRVGWSCGPPYCGLVCPLLQPSVCLLLSWGVV